MRDLHSNFDVGRIISPVSVSDNTTQVRQIIDRVGFESLEFCIATGSIADVDATFTVLVEHGDVSTLNNAAAVPDDLLISRETAAGFRYDDDDKTRRIGYIGEKRYVRLTITPAGNSSAALITAVAVLGHPIPAPVA